MPQPRPATQFPVRRALAVLFAAVALTVSIGGSTVAALPLQDEGSAPTDGSEAPSFAVEPSTAEGPTGRAAFIYDIEPGQVVDDVIGISNLADVPQTFRVYGTDAFSTEDGSFALLTAGEEPDGVGSWVEFGAESYAVPPRSRLDLPFKMRVPANATPGDHAGGVVAAVLEEGAKTEGQRVDIDRRVASRVYLRVKGPLTSELTIEQVSVDYDNPLNVLAGDDMVVTYRIRNTGNTRLTGTARVSAAGPGGLVGASAPGTSLPEMLPGSELTRRATISGVRPTVRVTAKVEVTPEPVGGLTGEAPATVAATEAMWAVPWLLLVVVVVAIVVWRVIRRRGRAADGGEDAPSDLVGDASPSNGATVDEPAVS